MNVRMRFDNPMLGGLQRRRFTRSPGAGRVESRPFSVGGVLQAPRAATLHAHQHLTLTRHSSAPVFRIAIQRPTAGSIQPGRDRIETQVLHEAGPVRELLRLDTRVIHDSAPERRFLRLDARPTADSPGIDTTTVRTRSLRELTESTVERVIRRRQRIESGRDSTVVMRERQNATAELERALTAANARTIDQAPALQSGNLNQPGPSSIASQPDLDRLTDQIVSRIDDRLIAHRERMGTSF